jgi:hypothetical protein
MGDKEKGVIEQIADTVNDIVEELANTASGALDDAAEPAEKKPDRQSVPSYEFPVPDLPVNPPSGLSTKASGKQAMKPGKHPGPKSRS